MNSITEISEDPLLSYSPVRQAAIVRYLLVQHVQTVVHDRTSVSTFYRSPDEIRIVLAAEVGRRGSLNASELATTQNPCRIRDRREPNPADPPRKKNRRLIFDQLIAEYGDRCAACGLNPAKLIDHDHFTGLVRGLLCLECNPRIDECLHNDSEKCLFAAYLNSPPTLSLGIKYPLENAVKNNDRIRADVLGFNFLDVRQWPSPIPAQWTWIAPPPRLLSATGCIRAQGITDEVVPRERSLRGLR